MPVDAVIASYSDLAFYSAAAVYLLAAVLHLGEYARDRVSVRVAAGAGGPDTAVPAPGLPGRPERPRSERFGRTAVALTGLGVLLHLGSVAARGVAVGRWPWGNMYEIISAICMIAVVSWLVLLRRNPGLRRIGAFLLLPVVVLMFLAGTVLYARAAPVVPALQSYWLVIHVTTISIASGMLLLAGVASALFLVRRSGRWPSLRERLPAADSLDRLAYRVTVIAVPIFTFAVITGGIWAEAAWGRFWGWDPKETVSFVSWVVYACYLHARATAGWRAGGAAWINVAGLATVLFNLFFINLVTAGLHSYAGVS